MADTLKDSCRLGVVFLLCYCCVACSFSLESTEQREAEVNTGQYPSADSLEPLTLQVVEDHNDGVSLHVLAKVTANTQWPRSAARVRLLGFKDGQITAEDVKELTQGVGATDSTGEHSEFIEQGESLLVPLVLPVLALTDYQVEISWSAATKPDETAGVAAHSYNEGLELRDLAVARDDSRCLELPCEVAFKLTGRVFNGGAEPVTEARLGVGFIWRDAGQNGWQNSRQVPQNEEEINIQGLSLIPGASKSFALNIERWVPFTKEGGFEPVVRILPR